MRYNIGDRIAIVKGRYKDCFRSNCIIRVMRCYNTKHGDIFDVVSTSGVHFRVREDEITPYKPNRNGEE